MSIKAVRMFVVRLFDNVTYTTSNTLVAAMLEDSEHTFVETTQLIVDTDDNSWMNNHVYVLTWWSDVDNTYKKTYHASLINLGKILAKWESPVNPELSMVVVIG